MIRRSTIALFLGLLMFVASALAAVVPLEGSTPQHAPVNVTFPNPVTVQVLDDSGHPAAGASVRYQVSIFASLVLESFSNCYNDLVWICWAVTDSNGRATLHSMHASAAGEYQVTVTADNGDISHYGASFGSTVITLIADPLAQAGRLNATTGNGQRTVIGTPFGSAFGIHAEYSDGTPMANRPITFRVNRAVGYATGEFVGTIETLGINWNTRTDGNGNAYSGPFVAEWGIGTGRVDATIFDDRSGVILTTPIAFVNTNAQGGSTLALQNMWWFGEAEAGWGVSVVQHAEKLFSMIFTYDATGKPTWYVMSDGTWANGLGSWFTGAFHTAKGSPFYNYDASRFALTRVGDMVLAFNGDRAGSLTTNFFTTPVSTFGSVRKSIKPFDFASDVDTSIRGVGDMWWGGVDQAGWGISIIEQPGRLFSIWFTYDDLGDPTWFVMSDGAWTSANTFEGRIARTNGPPWQSPVYDVRQFGETDVGFYRLTFFGQNAAQFEYNVQGRTGTQPLVRYPFD